MKRITHIAISLLMLGGNFCFGQADACASAGTLTIGGALTCGQTTSGSTLQGGECFTNYGGGSSETSVWYRIDATNDSLVLNFVQTNTTNCFPHIAVYGPFANGAGCLPCGTPIYNTLQNGDPGSHILLTGLATTGNNDYLVQIQGNECGGPNSSATNFCISVANPATNSTAANATLIDECGTAFSNTTNGGYYQAGTSTGFNNLDGNNATTCTGCSQAGDDTPFVINNVSWSTFCSLTSGTWQITVNGISGCTLASPNQGIQASVFTGTSSALVNQGNSASPLAPGASYTSPTITVNAGQCAYLMIDGFAGDACNYSVTLTNISGGCVILPLSFGGMDVYRENGEVIIQWLTYSESDNAYFKLERSYDGSNFTEVTNVPSIGNHGYSYLYTAKDLNARDANVYYRLSVTDKNGEESIIAVKYVHGEIESNPDHFLVYPNPANDIVNLEFMNPFAETTAKIEVFNLSGTYYKSENRNIKNGMNNLGVSIADFPEGNYVVRITTPYRVYTEKMVRQN